MLECDECGTDTPDGSRFCPSCGAALAKCGACGFVNRVGDRFCAHCGRVFPLPAAGELAKAGPAALVSPPTSVVGITGLAVGSGVLLLAALFVALIGLGSPNRSGNIPPHTIAVSGVDPTTGRVIRLDLSAPISVRGTLPPFAASADTIKLSFSAADIELGSASAPLSAAPNGSFAASFRTTGGRYLLAGRATGKVALLSGSDVRARQSFAVRSRHWPVATLPGALTLFGLYSLSSRIAFLIRAMRRGRRRISGPVRLTILGGMIGVVLVGLAWVFLGKEPTIATLVTCGLLGAFAGLSGALAAVQAGDRTLRIFETMQPRVPLVAAPTASGAVKSSPR